MPITDDFFRALNPYGCCSSIFDVLSKYRSLGNGVKKNKQRMLDAIRDLDIVNQRIIDRFFRNFSSKIQFDCCKALCNTVYAKREVKPKEDA